MKYILLGLLTLLVLNGCSTATTADVPKLKAHSSAKLCYEYNQGYKIGSQLYYKYPVATVNDVKTYVEEIKKELLRRGVVTPTKIKAIDEGRDICEVK